MKERPILMSAPKVRAILEGTKTQTRRVVKPQPDPGYIGHFGPGIPFVRTEKRDVRCPFGQPGHRLWVRETFRHVRTTWQGATPDVHHHRIRYLACGAEIEHQRNAGDFSGLPQFIDESYWDRRAIPSIHMPRWASRILLEITAVRVERLQDISPADCVCEGYQSDMMQRYAQEELAALDWYRALWEQLNGSGSWEANPWVWVVEFKRIEIRRNNRER